MAKTVSAPASSSYLPPLSTSRLYQPDPLPGIESRPVASYPSCHPPVDRTGFEPEPEHSPLQSPSSETALDTDFRGSMTSHHDSGMPAVAASGRGAKEHEEEDEVMSEGVVHMKKQPASPQKARSSRSGSQAHPPMSISTSTTTSPPQGSPTTMSPQTPKTKPQKSKTRPKRSQDPTGRKSQKDHGDYFYSPFPSSTSPSSSPSSPSSFQTQLQLLTHNFVSVQPHASPTHRFRRVPSAIITATATPPFSPPASPDASFHAGSISATSSPTKSSSQSAAVVDAQSSVPTLRSVTRSGSKPSAPLRPHFKPRWHTQPYMMFLALRAMPGQTAARQELITAAVELDKKISAEKGLPRVFTGKVSFFC